jgi:hypothetical protein
MLKLLISMGLCVAAYGAVARPGTINYVEGQVNLDGREVATSKLGSTEVAPGHVLETGHGKAEMLLTPGVYLRLGDNSAVRMVEPSLTDTRVDLLHGRALLEVDLLQKENRLAVRDGVANVQIAKKGLYEFNADQPQVAVYDGKAVVQTDDKSVDVKKGKELPLTAGAALKPQKFNRNESDDLMAWSKLRSQYLADANAASAQTVVVDNPGWWAGTGWYWNPWYSTWAFLPGSGFLYNPWGFGFYSPSYFYYNPPLYYGGVGRVWTGGVRGPRGGGAVGARPAPAPVGGSGVGFGAARPSAPRMAAPRMAAPRMAAPRMAAPMGGGGVRFGGRR